MAKDIKITFDVMITEANSRSVGYNALTRSILKHPFPGAFELVFRDSKPEILEGFYEDSYDTASYQVIKVNSNFSRSFDQYKQANIIDWQTFGSKVNLSRSVNSDTNLSIVAQGPPGDIHHLTLNSPENDVFTEHPRDINILDYLNWLKDSNTELSFFEQRSSTYYRNEGGFVRGTARIISISVEEEEEQIPLPPRTSEQACECKCP